MLVCYRLNLGLRRSRRDKDGATRKTNYPVNRPSKYIEAQVVTDVITEDNEIEARSAHWMPNCGRQGLVRIV